MPCSRWQAHSTKNRQRAVDIRMTWLTALNINQEW
jgi:hypothetical protein